MKTITKLKTGAITVAVVAVIIIISSVWRCVSSSNSVSAADSTRTEISTAQIRSMRSIGQWEFLTVSDEELVDTVRHGFFGDDELIRIYYGTLRLGCDLSKASDNWCAARATPQCASCRRCNCSTTGLSMRPAQRHSSKKANGATLTVSRCTAVRKKP